MKEKNNNTLKVATRSFTYVGAGESSPAIIKFMGKISFVLGKEVEIEDTPANAHLLSKISGNQVFKEGKVKEEEIVEISKKAKEKADKQRKKDLKSEQKVKKQSS